MVLRLSLGGLGVLWVAASRKAPECWFARRAQLCELTEALRAQHGASGPQADEGGPAGGSLWSNSAAPTSGHWKRRPTVTDATLYCTVIWHK